MDVIFLAIISVAAVIAVSYVQTRILDQMDIDVRNVMTFIFTTVAVVLIAGWFWFWSPLPWLLKILVPVSVMGLFCAFFRVEEFDGDMKFRIVSRFQPRPDELLTTTIPTAPANRIAVTPTSRDYPRFLGSDLRATVNGLNLETDWTQHPPREVWRVKIGAGWSGFSVVGNLAVTQEQRGNLEMVTCYDLQTGQLVWAHSDEGRFSEFLGGDGPRATPTIHDNQVYAQGAFGILNCLDLASGELVWSQNIAEDNNADVPTWGFSGSPLIVDDRVVVSAGGQDGKCLVAYDKRTGERIWRAGDDMAAYASPAVTSLCGQRQILSINEGWLRSHRVKDGKLLWGYKWPSTSDREACASQPVPLGEDRVFLSKGYGQGFAIIQVKNDDGKYSIEELKSDRRYMKTKMTNIVIRDGFAYGLSGGFLECLDLTSGRKKWKQGREDPYEHGQIMLVDDIVLVTSELGDVALVRATPEGFDELARIQALSDKTWNNPALAGRRLLVRNHLEAVCYELPVRE